MKYKRGLNHENSKETNSLQGKIYLKYNYLSVNTRVLIFE